LYLSNEEIREYKLQYPHAKTLLCAK